MLNTRPRIERIIAFDATYTGPNVTVSRHERRDDFSSVGFYAALLRAPALRKAFECAWNVPPHLDTYVGFLAQLHDIHHGKTVSPAESDER